MNAPFSGFVREAAAGNLYRVAALVLELVARPPVSSGRHVDAVKDLEGIGWSIELALKIDFEVVSIVAVAAEDPQLEPRSLQSPVFVNEPDSLAMMSQLGSGSVKSSWRIPSACGRGMKSVCPVVSQMPVRRTNPSTGLNPSPMR